MEKHARDVIAHGKQSDWINEPSVSPHPFRKFGGIGELEETRETLTEEIESR